MRDHENTVYFDYQVLQEIHFPSEASLLPFYPVLLAIRAGSFYGMGLLLWIRTFPYAHFTL